jgi:hypothetical protein
MLNPIAVARVLEGLGWLAANEALTGAALERLQKWFGLDPTGQLDVETERVIADRVLYGCGNADHQQSATICKWPTTRISYHVVRTPTSLPEEQARAAYRRAWESWEEVCGLKVTEVSDPNRANVLMDVGRGRRSGFDGQSGVLAWSELPCGNPVQLTQRYDLDERFGTTVGGGTILLENVACHEIGHAIGINHIAPALGQALMNPTYSSRVAKPLALDVNEATKRYGKSTSAPTTPPTERQVTITIKDPGAITINGKPYVG